MALGLGPWAKGFLVPCKYWTVNTKKNTELYQIVSIRATENEAYKASNFKSMNSKENRTSSLETHLVFAL